MKSRKETAPPQELSAGERVVAKAKADIQESGWHLLMVQGGDGPSFLYTIGLWETYKHPELILFSPSGDPRNVAKTLWAMVQRIAAGEKLKSGQVYSKVFKDYDGAIREVRPRWFASYLGTAAAVYGTFDFPAAQLYWPDRDGRFPWQDGFDPVLFPRQPVLYQDNIVLANAGAAQVKWIVEDEGPQALESSLDDLFIRLDDAARKDLLADWRWRVGSDAELMQVTIFGDLFLKTPDGHIHWLNTGSDFYVEAAADRESWLRLLCDRPAIFFHASTLLHFRSLDYLPKEGQVYSWIHPPMLGGEDSMDNFDTVPALVHLLHLGRTARGLAAGN